MEDVKCKKIKAIYTKQNEEFEKPVKCTFNIDDQIKVSISQNTKTRLLVITSNKKKSFNKLYEYITKIERLLMIFDGQFFFLEKIEFFDYEEKFKDRIRSYEIDILRTRLDYYKSGDFCKNSKIIDFEKILSKELYIKWDKLLKELDVVHQLFLYMVSDNKLTIDIKCAFLIELCESLVEILNQYYRDFPSLKPGKKGTTLNDCINAVITKYGTDIFEKELNFNINKVIEIMVCSRVKIMHIKRNKTKILNGEESLIYCIKIMLLYRKIILILLGLDKEDYENFIYRIVKKIDIYEGIQQRFINKIK